MASVNCSIGPIGRTRSVVHLGEHLVGLPLRGVQPDRGFEIGDRLAPLAALEREQSAVHQSRVFQFGIRPLLQQVEGLVEVCFGGLELHLGLGAKRGPLGLQALSRQASDAPQPDRTRSRAARRARRNRGSLCKQELRSALARVGSESCKRTWPRDSAPEKWLGRIRSTSSKWESAAVQSLRLYCSLPLRNWSIADEVSRALARRARDPRRLRRRAGRAGRRAAGEDIGLVVAAPRPGPGAASPPRAASTASARISRSS